MELVRVVDYNIHPVLNLSSRLLTLEEQEVLLFGLKFAPTPSKIPDPLEYYESYHTQCERAYNKLINRKSSEPLPRLIEEHLSVIKDKLTTLAELKRNDQETIHQHWQNLSKRHQTALRKLSLDKSLTIKPADKGSCIVVTDTQRYLKEGLEELADSNVYVELEEDPSLATDRTSNAILEKHCRQGMITQHTLDKYSTNPDNVRQQRMHFLRKVHKSPHQLRPIVSCCSGPTQKISQLANNLLKDYLNTVPSLITSSTQVIHAIEALSIPMEKRDSLLLATLDVKALYPSIP